MPATARAVIVIISALTLSACQEDGLAASSTDLSSAPDLLATQRNACTRDGGTFAPRGNSLFVCFRPTRDANQFCEAPSDCESVCLARSKTCAPTTPFLGCHEVLTESGRRATECVN